MINLLVTYDVATTTTEGRKRLRRVAQVCQDFGQRVQYSVFECQVGEADLVRLRTRLIDEIELDEDSVRLYRLEARYQDVVECYGKDRRIDFQGPLVV